ncbi:hypothetical protein, partial [Winogradskyella psychrotolerans]|uniref:hypothetical protein n=1 Tax=Winogradskyella psychrotolerans TaxID=1344585 RepID=UPI00059458AB
LQPRQNELFPDLAGTKPFDFHELALNPKEEIMALVKESVSKMSGKKWFISQGIAGYVCS